ncbi:hypothetical protein EDB83DRAFT_2674132 [Lactarius deliciosus]|nr:hypothetical protein EDB83DRAFT_2674132 [Lactarius deliciosus]
MHNYPFSSPMLSPRSKSHVMIAPEDFSPMRLEYASANAGPAAASGFSDVYGFAHTSIHRDRGYLTGCHRAGAREQHNVHPDYTTSPASHKFAPLLVVKPFALIPAAVYRMCIIVAFSRLPLAWHGTHQSILAAMLLATVGLPRSPASASAEPFTGAQEYDEFYHGLDEVNLLEELSAGTPTAPSFSNTLRPIAFPSTEIGAKIHKRDFAFPASPPSVVDLCSTTPTPATRATLRKSSRRTPVDVPCFHVRTMFVLRYLI